ncbi:MAG: PQQ-binding-like beta-propeller repeat protein [Chloroflexi bacterium]|nr:PQQ-binding-like beta-propeller repeat protein [Chloroflexota bacterium]
MKRMVFLALVAMLILTGVMAYAADWPVFRGPNGDGISTETGINKSWNQKPPKKLWETDMHDNGYAGPSVAGGKVFIIDHRGDSDILRAIDITTGELAWQYAYKDASKDNFGFARSTPAVDSGRVYTLSRLGTVNCLDAKTGKKICSRNICKDFNGKKPNWDYAMSPFIDGNKIILVPGGPDACVVALDKTTGRTIWQGGGSDEPGYCTPQKATINGKQQYVIFAANSLMGVAPDTGKQLWSFEWKTNSGVNAASPIVMGNTIFIASSYNHGCALVEVTDAGAKALWQNKEIMAHFSSPILFGGYIYGVGDPGFLMCLDPKTGVVKWKQEGFEKGPLLGIDGVMLVFDGKNGDLVMAEISPDAYKEICRFTPLGGQSWTAPIVSNGKLIVRNKTALACFSLR